VDTMRPLAAPRKKSMERFSLRGALDLLNANRLP
jgi:hypothetical protein